MLLNGVWVSLFNVVHCIHWIREYTIQWAKSLKTDSEGVRFDNSAFKIQCHAVKSTLLQTAFFGDFAHWEDVIITILF